MFNLYNFSRKKLEDLLISSYNQKKYCATQLFNWLYTKNITSFDLMNDISKEFRVILKKDFYTMKSQIYTKVLSKDGTIKMLIKLNDNNLVETVIMPYRYGRVLCVSSQVGCNMHCAFCASGLLKKKRNLETYEMLSELMLANEILKNEKISHVVIMGTGEPFDNYDNVMDFIHLINDDKAFGIGARHITVSTCGLSDKIMIYAKEKLQINLAISLHASDNFKRNKIMPINYRYPLEILMNAARFYVNTTHRRITFEYILLKNFNDSWEDAKKLAKLIKGIFSYVNLILYNKIEENNFERSELQHAHKFLNWLKKLGINTRIRCEFGNDIAAACGQLRAQINI